MAPAWPQPLTRRASRQLGSSNGECTLQLSASHGVHTLPPSSNINKQHTVATMSAMQDEMKPHLDKRGG